MLVNYGLDKMKFGQPVKSGQSVRLVADLYAIEIKDSPKKALTGIATFLYYFE